MCERVVDFSYQLGLVIQCLQRCNRGASLAILWTLLQSPSIIHVSQKRLQVRTYVNDASKHVWNILFRSWLCFGRTVAHEKKLQLKRRDE